MGGVTPRLMALGAIRKQAKIGMRIEPVSSNHPSVSASGSCPDFSRFYSISITSMVSVWPNYYSPVSFITQPTNIFFSVKCAAGSTESL